MSYKIKKENVMVKEKKQPEVESIEVEFEETPDEESKEKKRPLKYRVLSISPKTIPTPSIRKQR